MLTAKLKKWGNSYGIPVPKRKAKELGLHEGQEVAVQIQAKGNPLREMFGSLKFDKPTKQLLKEIRGKESRYW